MSVFLYVLGCLSTTTALVFLITRRVIRADLSNELRILQIVLGSIICLLSWAGLLFVVILGILLYALRLTEEREEE